MKGGFTARPQYPVLLGGKPVRARTCVNLERWLEFTGATHLTPGELSHGFGLVGGAFEQKLIVNLEDKARTHAGLGKGQVAADHRHLDDSAAEPWITVLTASRIPWRLVFGWLERNSGSGRRRPRSVVA